MSPQPPRTPPNDRLIDRNRFIPFVDREVDRRLRQLEANPATTVVQQTTTTTSSGSTGTTWGPPAYSVATTYPVYVNHWSSVSEQADPRRLLVVDEDNDLGYGAGALVVVASNAATGALEWWAYIIDPSHSNVVAAVYLQNTALVSSAVADYLEPTHLCLLPGTILWTGGWPTGQSKLYFKRLGIDGTAQGGWDAYNASRVGDKVWFGAVKDTSTTGHLSYLTKSGTSVVKTDVNITGDLGSGTSALFSSAGTTKTQGAFTGAGHWVGGYGGTGVYFITDAGVSTFCGTPANWDITLQKAVVSTSSGYAALRFTAGGLLSTVQVAQTSPAFTTTLWNNLIADEANVVVSQDYDNGCITQVNGTTFAVGLLVRNTSTDQRQARVYLLSAGGSTLVWSSSWAANYVSGTTNQPTPRFNSITCSGGSTLAWSVYSRVQTGPSSYETALAVYRGAVS